MLCASLVYYSDSTIIKGLIARQKVVSGHDRRRHSSISGSCAGLNKSSGVGGGGQGMRRQRFGICMRMAGRVGVIG